MHLKKKKSSIQGTCLLQLQQLQVLQRRFTGIFSVYSLFRLIPVYIALVSASSISVLDSDFVSQEVTCIFQIIGESALAAVRTETASGYMNDFQEIYIGNIKVTKLKQLKRNV